LLVHAYYYLLTDCTGPTRAGLKWLRRAGFDLIDSPDSPDSPDPSPDRDGDDSGKHGIKLVYDQKVRYATLELYLTPDVVKRLPAACRWDSAGLIYGCTTDPRIDGNAVYAMRIEKDTGTYAILVSISLKLTTTIYSPLLLRNTGRRRTSTDSRWLQGVHESFDS
jgi:hypothetical protein